MSRTYWRRWTNCLSDARLTIAILVLSLLCPVTVHALPLTGLSLKTASLVHDKQTPAVDKLTANGSFRLGAGNNGANPANESVTFTLGPFSLTIPPQSFKQTDARGKKTWKYTRFEPGLTRVVITNTGDNWTFSILATKLTLTVPSNPNPLSINLSIGDDSGTISRFFVIKDTPRKLLLKFPAGKKDDADGDGFTTREGDCDDQDPTIFPGAEELCDGVDNNCNGQIDEGALLTFFRDADNDGYGASTPTAQACEPPAGFVDNDQDCNDNAATVHPGATELCDSVDNNCDGQIDEGATLTFYRDADGDSFGDPANSAQACVAPSGYVSNNQDCNDSVATIHPGATEVCNNVDDNCNNATDEGFNIGEECVVGVGACQRDGVTVCATNGNGTTCDGAPGTPTAEVCNNIDDNCNGQVDEGLGTISCGQGGCEQTVAACINGQPGLCTPGTPKAEICENGIDEDCNGSDLTCVVTLDITITGPANLSSTNRSTIPVTGSVDPTATEVTCNGRPAGINTNGFGGNVPLKEGSNIITCVAKDAEGNLGSASISVSLDSTPPRVTIDSPGDGAVVTTSPISITGLVNDLVMGTVNGDEAGVRCNGVQAQVANRRFVVTNVSLNPGANTVTCIGEDKVGNIDTARISVTLDTTAQAKITIVSGNNQTAGIGAPLPQPFVVGLTENGAPAVGKVVVFKVLQNDGELSANGTTGRLLGVNTDANGQAQVNFTLGSWAGAGNNQVEATAAGFVGEARFSASAQQAGPNSIVVDAGNMQFGAVDQPLPKPFIATVIDRGSNRLGGVPVTFSVKDGGGNFNGQPQTTVTTDSDGRAAAVLTLGPDEGFDNNLVEASFPNNPTFAASFTASGKTVGEPEDTKISGVVLDNSNNPIEGVTLHIEGTSLTTQSNEQGQFLLQPAPVGHVKLLADGSTAPPRGGKPWPKLEYELVTIAGRDNTIGMPIYLLPIDTPRGLLVDETHGGTLTLDELPGFALTIVPGSATFPDGSKRGTVSVTLVHADKVPMVPNFGQQPRFIITIQPAGTHFNPPAALTMPNVDGFAPGQKTEMYSFDHDLGSFVSIGPATVSEDGTVIESDPGVGVVKGGWHCGGNPSPSGGAQNAFVNVTSVSQNSVQVGEIVTIEAEGGPLPGSFTTVDWESAFLVQSDVVPVGSKLKLTLKLRADTQDFTVTLKYTCGSGTSAEERPRIKSKGFFFPWTRGVSWTLNQSFHGDDNGLDFNGQPIAVLAAAPAIVAFAAYQDGPSDGYCFGTGDPRPPGFPYRSNYGNFVVLKHTDTTYTLYAHLMREDIPLLLIGQEVSAGTIIGYKGNSGRSCGEHLHFGVVRDANDNSGLGVPSGLPGRPIAEWGFAELNGRNIHQLLPGECTPVPNSTHCTLPLSQNR